MVPWHCMVHYRMCNWTGWHYKSNSQCKMPTSIQSHDIYRLFNQSIVHYVCCYVMWSANAFRFLITCKYIFIFQKSIFFYCILFLYFISFWPNECTKHNLNWFLGFFLMFRSWSTVWAFKRSCLHYRTFSCCFLRTRSFVWANFYRESDFSTCMIVCHLHFRWT